MNKKFFCSNCMKTHESEINYEPPKFDIKDSNINPSVHINFTYSCDCGNKMQEIDEKMFDFIIRLNKLGYYTEYCCEGHWENDSDVVYGFPYIKFTSGDNDFRDDYIHWMGHSKEYELIKFLEENLEFPLHFYINPFDYAIVIEIDTQPLYEGLNGEEMTEGLFNTYKKNSLEEFDRIITLLEEKKGN